jgi:anti-sigma factor RsiW
MEDTNDQCPTTEQFAAYLDDQLTIEERKSVESHLAHCKRCRRIASVVVKSSGAIDRSSQNKL